MRVRLLPSQTPYAGHADHSGTRQGPMGLLFAALDSPGFDPIPERCEGRKPVLVQALFANVLDNDSTREISNWTQLPRTHAPRVSFVRRFPLIKPVAKSIFRLRFDSHLDSHRGETREYAKDAVE